MNIRGKVAIVTGASSGIGEATAKLLSARGAKVVLAARSKNKLAKLGKILPDSLVVTADMTKPSRINAMVKTAYKHFGRIDILVNNAGRGYDAPIEYIESDKLHELFDLDVLGPLLAMQLVIPFMRKQRAGSIVNISSGTSLMYIPNMAAYSSMKRALNGISLTAREELKRDHIAVSVVYPFITKTDFDKNLLITKDAPMQWNEHSATDLPPADSPEFVAERIVDVIETGKPEIYAHEWMKKFR